MCNDLRVDTVAVFRKHADLDLHCPKDSVETFTDAG
jgi:hypothetical protein